MAINFQNVADKVTDQGVKILVVGDPGVGKTMLAGTTGAPTLLVDAEAYLIADSGIGVHLVGLWTI